MGYVARGLYRELLDEQWVKGGIPEDMEQLANVCDCPLEIMQIEWPKMARCFSIKRRGLLMNGTLESMRTETDTRRTKRVLAGTKGGVKKAIGINADVAGAKHLPEAAKRVQANAGISHIGEERREEESKEKQKPSRRKAPSDEMKHSADPRHIGCKDLIVVAYQHKNGGANPEWDGYEGGALGKLLNANPQLNAETIKPLLQHWARSDINHSDRPGIWIPKLSSFRMAPVDRFNKPKEGENGSHQNQNGSGKSNGSPTKQRIDGARRKLAEIAVKRGLIDPLGGNGPSDPALPLPRSGVFDRGVSTGLRSVGPEILPPESSEGSGGTTHQAGPELFPKTG